MQIRAVEIRNFKSISRLTLENVDKVLILVGKNNTGKTSVLDAIRAVGGCYQIAEEDFNVSRQNIEVFISLEITKEDRQLLYQNGRVSRYRRWETWERDFAEKFPSYQDNLLEFTYVVNQEGKIRYTDGVKKHNKYISEIFPKIYFIDALRELSPLQDDLLISQEDEMLKRMRSNCCLFEQAKVCNHCFQCIGLIHQKTPEQLNAFETAKLLEYKLFWLNLNEFAEKVNKSFHKNGGFEKILYTMNRNVEEMLQVKVETLNQEQNTIHPIEHMGKGMRSIYLLSLLEAYVKSKNYVPSILMIEEPEIFLHPQMQKVSSEILYRLSDKNQVIFTTHSPNLLFHFNKRQIRQIILNEKHQSIAKRTTDIDAILDDLGFSANDLMNVSFVFIVEGKQDKSRLPLLLEKYYSEIYDKKGNLWRIAIITTNSCTNIKTYANLKYMNTVYLRDQFLMIRDGDGKDTKMLARQLCSYYEERNLEDADKLPKVTRRNVLILKYYSFENYFLNPKVMARLGVVESEDAFYRILFDKWKEYLYRIRSGQHLVEVLGKNIESVEELKEHIEEVKIYLRGHNLYDIFYGRYRNQEEELLRRYIEIAPRQDFSDILDAVEQFIYFEGRRQ